MGLLDSLFNKNMANIKNKHAEINMYKYAQKDFVTANEDYFYKVLFFSTLFYQHGFIDSPAQGPAFGGTSQYITPEIFNDTFIGLTVYFSLRYGIKNSGIKNVDELNVNISNIFNTFDNSILGELIEEWSKIEVDKLDECLFNHFNSFGIFDEYYNKRQVSKQEIKKWFCNFLNQCYQYT